MSLEGGEIARDGALLAALASGLVLLTLRVNPRLFIRHLPESARATLAPLSRDERIVGRVVAGVLMLLLVGIPLASARHAGYAAPADAFVHAFAVSMVFNTVDWLILDELLLGCVRPTWAAPPGVDAKAVPFEHGRHFRGFVAGTVLALGIGGLAAVLAR